MDAAMKNYSPWNHSLSALKSIQKLSAAALTLAGFATPACAASISVASQPSLYQPFDITITFDTPQCFASTYPLLGDVAYKESTLTIVLSHLKSGACTLTQKVRIPGLPPGAQTIIVQVTKGETPFGGYVEAFPNGSKQYTTVATTVSGVVNVDATASGRADIFTYRDDGGGLVTPPSADRAGLGPIVIGNGRLVNAALGVRGDWLEIGGRPTFSTLTIPVGGSIPDELTALRLVLYPTPLLGVFATADSVLADRLSSEWRTGSPPEPTLIAGDYKYGLVGKLRGGICPLGMSPVYQAFHPVAIGHRYTQSSATYRMLLANGYVGDGAAFCAPVQ